VFSNCLFTKAISLWRTKFLRCTGKAYFLREWQINQVQLDELYAVLSAVREGEVSEADAIERLSRSPPGCGPPSIPKVSCCCVSRGVNAR
jgi:hypothetical protein